MKLHTSGCMTFLHSFTTVQDVPLQDQRGGGGKQTLRGERSQHVSINPKCTGGFKFDIGGVFFVNVSWLLSSLSAAVVSHFFHKKHAGDDQESAVALH